MIWNLLHRGYNPASASRKSDVFYFAYNANIDPERLGEVAPSASFEFIAHLPEWKLEFTALNGSGGQPTARPLPGNTVWGAVFTVDETDLASIDAQEESQGRVPTRTQAMDREGRRHDVVTHVAGHGSDPADPEQPDLESMVAGGRHWNLPMGWVASLEEHLHSR